MSTSQMARHFVALPGRSLVAQDQVLASGNPKTSHLIHEQAMRIFEGLVFDRTFEGSEFAIHVLKDSCPFHCDNHASIFAAAESRDGSGRESFGSALTRKTVELPNGQATRGSHP